MVDLTEKFLPRLRGQSLPDLKLGDEFIYPDYRGTSILNLPASICRCLGLPDFGGEPLIPEIQSFLGSDVRRVVLVLMDALSLERLRRWIASDLTPLWGELAQEGVLAPLTSIVPSTTSAVLPTLWTGRNAAEHGITGYEMWLKEYGLVANTILHTPMSFREGVSSLRSAGFDPETFLALPTLGTHLLKQGVQAYAFQHENILGSGLSQMMFNDVKVSPFSTPTDLWINLRLFLERNKTEGMYVWVYWGQVDRLGHFYGPDDERAVAEFASFSAACERHFLDRLSPQARQGTLLILTADHGQITTTPDPHYDLRNHPNLARRLHMYPTGENRLMYLFIRPGQVEAVREYLERTWPRQFVTIDPAYAVQAGLFGPGRPHPRLFDRLGDLLVAARGRAYLWWSEKENLLIGRHGGLSADEMLVPFLAVRL